MRRLLTLAFLCSSAVAFAQTGTMPGSRNVLGNQANLDKQGQILRGGAIVRSVCATGALDVPNTQCVLPSTFTVDCGLGPLQYSENNGAISAFTAPVNDGSCFIMLYNGASAGAVTFSGFSVATGGTGATMVTTAGNLYTISIWRITIPGVGSTAGYTIFAHQ